MNKFRLVFLYICFILFLFLCSACAQDDSPQRGDVAPDFEAKTIDGQVVKLSQLRGKVVMLYFWADWCPACKKEFPETQAYYEKLKVEDFEIIAINVAQPIAASEKFRDNYKATFKMIADEKSAIAKLYGIKDQLPINYFINKEGEVIRKIVGWVDANQVNVMIHQNR
jgi:peroxiredoxin